MIVETDGCARKLPDFIVIGAAKSGTTSLYFYLRQHPSIFMPADIKEPGFFCFAGMPRPAHPPDNPHPYFWNWAVTDVNSYSALFEAATDKQIIGEATPEYLYLYEKTIANIKSCYGSKAKDLKLIVILRDPVDRAWSHYSMARRDRFESLQFEQAADEKVIAQRLRNGWHPSYDYLGFGFYSKAIAAYLREFGKDNVKILLTEDLAANAATVCTDLFRFLGVDPTFQPHVSTIYNTSGKLKHPKLHKLLFLQEHFPKTVVRKLIPFDILQGMKHKILAWNAEKNDMSDEVRARLRETYRDDVARLGKLINKDISAWLAEPRGRVVTQEKALN